jgi:drug/metabolite transporter (DMT)-like permease
MSPYDFDTGIPFFQAGELYALSCALLWAVAVILFRKTGETIEPVALNLFKGVVGLALFLVTMPIFGVPWFPQGVSLADWLVLMGSGALGIAIADSVWARAARPSWTACTAPSWSSARPCTWGSPGVPGCCRPWR